MTIVRKTDPPVPAWKRAFLEGFAPLLSDCELTALMLGLSRFDPKLIQGFTCLTALDLSDGEVVAADAIAYALWRSDEPQAWDAEHLHSAFYMLCLRADENLGGPGECTAFVSWWDNCPRTRAFPALQRLVKQVLFDREEVKNG